MVRTGFSARVRRRYRYMSRRTIAIGDIHGCSTALEALLAAIDPQPDDVIVSLGDYIDRGPDSRGVIERLIALAGTCQLIVLEGDHEAMLADALQDRAALKRWITCGGTETLRSYGWSAGTARRTLGDWIPVSHQDFLAGCRLFYETPTHLFVHAGYVPELPLEQQPRDALLRRTTHASSAVPHCSGKIAIVGHTRQLSGEILDLGFVKCIDTNCVRGGWLTALEVTSGQVWQANREGELRNG